MTLRTTVALSRTLLVAALAATAVALPAQSVSAQQIAVARDFSFGGFGGGDGLNAPIGKSDLEVMGKLLQFNGDQSAAAAVLLESYLSEHAKRAEPMRKEQEAARAAFREDRDFSAFADLAPKLEAFAKESEAKQRELVENIKGLLEKTQLEQWPVWERANRRAKSMNRGMLAGERADLIQIVDRLKFATQTMTVLTPALDAYAMELDRAIVAREEAQKTAAEEGRSMRDAFSKNGGAGMDMTEMMKKGDELMKKSREASIPVRDVNRKYARQIEATLTGINAADAERFAREFRRSSFPDVYRERYTDKALAAAAAIEGLDKAQQEGIAALQEQYARDKAPLEKAAEDAENNFSLAGMVGGGGMMRMMNGDEATQAARKARRELDSATLDKLKAILTPDQVAKLPDRAAETTEPAITTGGGVRIMTR